MSEPVRTDVDQRGVATITLQRPEVRNAFDAGLIAALHATVDAAAGDDAVRAVVLTGSQGAFSAGADLRWMRAHLGASQADNLADAQRLEAMYRALFTLPKPLIARVDGAAIGGGAGLAVVGDVAVASDRSVIGFPEVALGLAPAVIAPYVLRRCPAGTARAALVTGRRFSAHEARAYGLVDDVAGTDELDDAVESWLAPALAAAPGAVAATKQLLERVDGLGVAEAAEATTRAIAALRVGEEGQAGMSAFLQGGRPPWQPRA
jgi:methylglutaconyl-CoA hydratase